jgi:hypothetical protein
LVILQSVPVETLMSWCRSYVHPTSKLASVGAAGLIAWPVIPHSVPHLWP